MVPPYTILFVEDDTPVRESTAQLLAGKGFRLLVADNGFEALRVVAEEHVDVLFTDIVMYGMDGIELARRAKLHQPDIKIMFMTAYYSRATEAMQLGKLLFKPLRGTEIEAELTELLAAE
jgi:two-component system, cell cycle response regulator CpdR